jgi:hypothetical protein
MRHRKRPFAFAGLAGVLLFCAACSSSGSQDPPSTPAPADPPCTDTLTHVQSTRGHPCADSLPDTPAEICAASRANLIYLGSSNGLRRVSYSYGAGETDCVYRSSDGALVGIWLADDQPVCDGAFALTAGDVPTVAEQRICTGDGDGGAGPDAAAE